MRHGYLDVMLWGCLAMPARADIIEVPQDFPTIQLAIDAAVDGDEVVISPGVYVENLSLLSKDVLIRSLDPTDPLIVAATVVDGDAGGSVVDMDGGELRGLTIRNGFAPIGGGVIARADARVRFCHVTDNLASGQGGGVAAFDRSSIEHNRIIGNRSAGGGGLFASDLALVRGNLISGNFASGEGGGIDARDHAGLIVGNSIFGNISLTTTSGILAGTSRITGNIVAFSASDLPAIYADAGALVEFECIYGNAGGAFGGPGEFGDGNILQDPRLDERQGGRWTTDPFFDPQTFRTTFVDLGSPFEPGTLLGSVMRPNTSNAQRYAVVANTSNTVTVAGDALGVGGQGSAYLIEDWHLSAASPCLGAGDRNGPPPALEGTDLDGEPRVMDCLLDIGSDERTGVAANVLFVSSNTVMAGLESSPMDCSGIGFFTGGANLFFDGTPTVTLTAQPYNNVRFRWVIDGVEQAEGDQSVEIELLGPVTAVAEYDLVTNITIGLRFDTIQSAVASFSTGDGDEIVVAPGVYVENVDFLDKELFVHSSDPDDPDIVASTIIDGSQLASTVRLSAGEIQGFTVRNGLAFDGGGVFAQGTAMVTKNVIEFSMATHWGSGVYAQDAAVVTENLIRNNGPSVGAGVTARHHAMILDNSIEDNVASTASHIGGGVHALEDALVRGNLVRGNLAMSGGAIYARNRVVVMENIVLDNIVRDRGGGIHAIEQATVLRNWVAGNVASDGGGIWARDNLLVQGNVMIGNRAHSNGGGLFLTFGADAFANTIIDNISTLGGGGVHVSDVREEVRVVNNIIAFNGERGIVADDPVFLDYNCVFGHTSQNYGGLAFPGDNDINVDPLLDADRAHLLAMSPCIDAGVVGFRDPDGTDIDGDPRVINDRIDIGADEFAGAECPADLDGDNDADADDFFAYLDAFAGGNLAVCDLDSDGDCDADDFFAYLDLFAAGC